MDSGYGGEGRQAGKVRMDGRNETGSEFIWSLLLRALIARGGDGWMDGGLIASERIDHCILTEPGFFSCQI